MLSIWMVCQFRWASRHRTGEKKSFQVVEQRRIVLGAERDGCSVFASSTSTADTMRVIFDRLGHVVVDDQRHIFNVNTTTGNVGGYQNVFGSRFQIGKSKLTLLLALATVQSTSIELNKEIGKMINVLFN